MSSSIDEWVGTEVERSFAGEPPLRDPREYAARGRRAQRRRRAAAGALGFAAVAVVAALAVGGLHPGAGQREAQPTGDTDGPVRGTTELPVDPTTDRQCARQPEIGCGRAIGWDDLHSDTNGDLVRGYPDVEITGRYDDVYSPSYRGSSALEVRRDGRVAWVLATWSDEGVGIEFSCADPTRTFDQWVADSSASQLGGAWRDYACPTDARSFGSPTR